MEEGGHLMALSLGLERFLSVSILRIVRALPDHLRLSSSVVPAHGHTVGGWIAASVTPRFAFGLATGCFTGDDVGQRHGAFYHANC